MKSKFFLFCISLGSLFISCQPKLTAEEIIHKSLEEAHGGKANWELPKILVYEKTTILYDSLGIIENQKKQLFHNTLQPEFTSAVTWEENGIQKRVLFDGTNTQLFFDEIAQTDTKAIEKAHEEIIAAQYVLWQPYKLLYDEASLLLERKVRLEDGSSAYKIKVTYTDTDTEWWYYFDTSSFLLKENLVKHGTTFSNIKNIKHEEETGLRLHKERKSFLVDVEKNQKYLRAHYFYTILKLE